MSTSRSPASGGEDEAAARERLLGELLVARLSGALCHGKGLSSDEIELLHQVQADVAGFSAVMLRRVLGIADRAFGARLVTR